MSSPLVDATLLDLELRAFARRMESAASAGLLSDSDITWAQMRIRQGAEELAALREIASADAEVLEDSQAAHVENRVLDDVYAMLDTSDPGDLADKWEQVRDTATRKSAGSMTRKSVTPDDDDVYSELSPAERAVVSSYRGYLAEQR